MPQPQTTMTSERQPGYNNTVRCLTCDSEEFFFSRMIPTGMFCTSCGRPDVITETTFAAEEGPWD
jgi:hypothetical protein